MEDSSKIIPDGTATPYLAVFNGMGKPIYDPSVNIPIGMLTTNFTYVYDEENDDTFEITIETDNPNLIDLPELGSQMPLQLQWGWIYPDGSSNSGPVRRVVIRDSSIYFTENGVRVVIKGTDAFSLTKVSPSNLEDKTFVKWLENNINGKYGINIVDYSNNNKLVITKKD